MMHAKRVRVSLAIVVTLFLLSGDALAWGPKARRAITITGLQMIRRTIPEAFKTEDVSYEEDVMRGANAGPSALGPSAAMHTADQAITSVGNEIQLLRATKRYGTGSYFAYRMGGLAALVSDLALPFSFENAPEFSMTQKQIEKIVEDKSKRLSFQPESDRLQFVRSPQEYFAKTRSRLADSERLIKADFALAPAASDYLEQASRGFMTSAIESVANVWYTVLLPGKDSSDVSPSAEAITWYLVGEIEYLLQVRHNIPEADRTYANFATVNPGIMAAYDRLGDIYYAYGATSRAVEQWQQAIQFSGEGRAQVQKKLSEHYLNLGRKVLDQAERPGHKERDLEDALNAFQSALEYDRTNDDIAALISKTRIAIKEREERRETAIRMIASAEKVVREAEAQEMSQAFADAIAMYKRSEMLYDGITDEFAAQTKAAKEGKQAVKKRVAKIINDMLDAAQEAIEKGDDLVDQNQFDPAIELYRNVPSIVRPIPSDPGSTAAKEKQTLIDRASAQLDRAEIEKQKYAELQKQRAEQAAKQAAGAPPAAPPPDQGGPAPAQPPRTSLRKKAQ